MNQARVFLAVDLNDNVKNKIMDIQDKFRKMNFKGRYTSKDNFHITIKFLGNVDLNVLDSIRLSLIDELSKVTMFNILLDKTGIFKGRMKTESDKVFARVLWISLNDENGGLSRLHDITEICLAKIGYAKENRPFKPHITLARDISLNRCSISDININLHPEISVVNKVVLYKSELIDRKRVYTPVWTINLKD